MRQHFPVNNLRQSINGVWQQIEKSYYIDIPDDGINIIRLPESPDNGTTTGSSDISIVGFTKTTTYPPIQSTFYVDYNNGYISFNPSDANTNINIVYWAKGSVIDAYDINYLNEKYIISDTRPTGYNGQQWYNTNNKILYSFDETDDKWLSVNRVSFSFGRKGLTNNQYLNFYAGMISSNNSGLRMVRDACIVSMSGQTSNLGDYSFHIRKNNQILNVCDLDVIGDYGIGLDTSVNINKNDILQCFFSSVFSVIRDPMLTIEVAWKI
jgi:hypothetical protein